MSEQCLSLSPSAPAEHFLRASLVSARVSTFLLQPRINGRRGTVRPLLLLLLLLLRTSRSFPQVANRTGRRQETTHPTRGGTSDAASPRRSAKLTRPRAAFLERDDLFSFAAEQLLQGRITHACLLPLNLTRPVARHMSENP